MPPATLRMATWVLLYQGMVVLGSVDPETRALEVPGPW